jgi:hypothetical protein
MNFICAISKMLFYNIIPGDQEGLFKLAIHLRIFFLIRLFITLQLDMFCWFI